MFSYLSRDIMEKWNIYKSSHILLFFLRVLTCISLTSLPSTLKSKSPVLLCGIMDTEVLGQMSFLLKRQSLPLGSEEPVGSSCRCLYAGCCVPAKERSPKAFSLTFKTENHELCKLLQLLTAVKSGSSPRAMRGSKANHKFNLVLCYKICSKSREMRAVFPLKTTNSQFQAKALEKCEGNTGVRQKNGNTWMSSRTCFEYEHFLEKAQTNVIFRHNTWIR